VSQGKLKCADELHAKHCRSGSEPSASQTEAITSTRMLLSFSVSEEFMAKMEQVRSIAWHRLPASASLEQVFQFVMEYFVAKEDPCVRREKCNARQEAAMNSRTSTISYPRRTRRIAAAVMGEVFARDEGRCTYIGASGKRCDSTRALQVDHITPFALGGKNLPGNLRLLCAYHNRLEAERLLGHPQSKSSGEPFR
jgi:5-methylcytosine-specific restriction endonuclease McrA